MKLVLGLLLIVLGLVGGYFVLSGKFPPAATSSGNSNSTGTKTGSGGVSIGSTLSHIGTPIMVQHNDTIASRGYR